MAIGLLSCTYGLEQWAQSQSNYFWIHSALTNVLTAAVAAGAVIIHLKNGRPVFSTLPREFWLVMCLIAWTQLSVVWSVFPQQVFKSFQEELQYIIPFAIVMPIAIGTIWDARQMLFSLLTIGTILCLLLLTTSDWHSRSIVFNTGSTFGAEGYESGNPLAIGNLGAYVGLAAMLLNFRGVARIWQILRYVVIGLCLGVAVKSGSRGQTIGFGLATLVFLPYSRRFKDFTSFLGFAISIVLFATVAFVLVDRLTLDRSGEQRDDRWTLDTFVSTYQDSRLGTAGRVLGCYIDGGPLVWVLGLGSSASGDPKILGSYPHMVPAEALAELGIPGFVMYWMIVYYSFLNIRDLWPIVRDDPEGRGVVATIGALVFFETFLTFKEGSLIGSSTFFGMSIVLGHIALNTRNEAARYREIDEGGYTLTADELAQEAAEWDEPLEHDDYAPVPAGHA